MSSIRHHHALLLLCLSAGCSFLLDFPEEGGSDAGGGVPVGAGNPQGAGGTGAQGGSGGSGAHGGEGAGGNVQCGADLSSMTFDWAYPLGTVSLDGYQPTASAIDGNGDIWIAAQLKGGQLNADGIPVVSSGDGVDDILLLQLDPMGQSKRGFVFGGTGTAWIWDMAFAPNGTLVLAGSFTGDMTFLEGGPTITATTPAGKGDYDAYDAYVAVFDPAKDESFTFAKAFGDGEYQEASAVGVDAGGNIFVAVAANGTIDWGNGPTPDTDGVQLAKLDGNLDRLWNRPISSNAVDIEHLPDLAVLPDGAVIVAGQTDTVNAFGGTTPGEVTYGGSDAFVVRYDANGAWRWHRIFGDESAQEANEVTFGASGEIYVAGTFRLGLKERGAITHFEGAEDSYDGQDIFFARLAPVTGETRWVQRIQGLGFQRANHIVVDCAERLFVVGEVGDDSTSTGVDFGDGDLLLGDPGDASSYNDLFYASYDGNVGDLISKKRTGDLYEENAASLLIDASGGVVLIGAFFDSLVLDPLPGGSLQKPSEWDLFVAHFNAPIPER